MLWIKEKSSIYEISRKLLKLEEIGRDNLEIKIIIELNLEVDFKSQSSLYNNKMILLL